MWYDSAGALWLETAMILSQQAGHKNVSKLISRVDAQATTIERHDNLSSLRREELSGLSGL
jgi:hypothetical protein